ncbi:hypothetical protein DY000_02053781 [Brassica cretica]|uniref:Uncharacterized protein n=1 Tax=Brassica cretica TaxID=69181 RepID=A0ABQ7AB18_BRACR|nr:hypothetical protein DY000_02053781 [Brassica cretica]
MALIGYLSFGVSLDSFSGFSLSVALPSTATELPLGVSPQSTTATDNYLGGSPPIERWMDEFAFVLCVCNANDEEN